MSDTIILSKGVPFVVDELTEEEERKFYAECGKRALQRAKEYWLSTGLFWDVGECKEAFDIAIAAMEQRWMPAADVPDRKVGKWIPLDELDELDDDPSKETR